MKFLKDFFASGHKAAGTLTPENMLRPATLGGAMTVCTWPPMPLCTHTIITGKWLSTCGTESCHLPAGASD